MDTFVGEGLPAACTTCTLHRIRKYKQPLQYMSSNMNQQIRMWSYNLFLRPPPIKNNEDDYKSQRFEMILDKISHFDIVCFQELFQTATFRLEEMIAGAIQRGFHYWANSQPTSFFSGRPVDSGLAVFSRYPILQSHFESYGIGVLSDSASDKGYIYCKISVNGSIIHLFNTHLQASYHTPGCDELRDLSVATRRHQCKILRDRVSDHLAKQNYHKGQLVLMCGDFNINANQPIIELPKDSPISAYNPKQFHQYTEMISLFQGRADGNPILTKPYKIKDLLFLNCGIHPTTYGQQEQCILTHKDEHGIFMRIDYIFQIQQNDSPQQLPLQPDIKSCIVDKSQVANRPFVQLSDHYGVQLRIAIKSK